MSSTQTLTNGSAPSSKFIDHLTSYPVVSDGIETFKSNPYGAKTIEVADGAYARFGKPFLPYLRTPYSYAAPYVQKADSLADGGLQSVDSHFPIVKEDTHTLLDSAYKLALQPFVLAGQSYNYVFSTWDDEYQKTIKRNNRGPGLTSSVMAIVSTEMKIASDALAAVADYLAPKKEAAKQKKDAFVSHAQHDKNNLVSAAKKNADTYQKQAQHKTS